MFAVVCSLSKKTITVDSETIDQALSELANLVIRQKEQNTIKKIEEIRNTMQDAVMYAKLKKSLQ